MAEKYISIQLTMASSPALPQQVRETRAAKPKLPPFPFMRLLQQAGAVLLIAALCWASYYAVSRYFLKTVKVVGVSMVPTLEEDGTYLLNLWAFRNREPQRNEIVVIRDPADHGLSVKRIVAVGGESVHFKNGKVFVDGRELNEPYLSPNTFTFTYSQAKEQFITCGKEQYFVLGDNRLRSIDSRAYGPVSRHDVLGLVQVH